VNELQSLLYFVVSDFVLPALGLFAVVLAVAAVVVLVLDGRALVKRLRAPRAVRAQDLDALWRRSLEPRCNAWTCARCNPRASRSRLRVRRAT